MAASDVNTSEEHTQVLSLKCAFSEIIHLTFKCSGCHGILYNFPLNSLPQSVTPPLYSNPRRGNTNCLHVQSSPLNSEPDWKTEVCAYIIKIIVAICFY